MATPWVTTYRLLELVLMKHSDLRPAAGAEGLIVFQLWQSLTVKSQKLKKTKTVPAFVFVAVYRT